MTDWGVHLLDIVQMAFNEQMPKSVSTFGEKFRLKDNRDTPDTIIASYEYPGFLATYENRHSSAPFRGQGVLGAIHEKSALVPMESDSIPFPGQRVCIPIPVLISSQESRILVARDDCIGRIAIVF